MKKTLFLSLFISFNVFGQTPKMEIVASTTEDIGGIKVVLKKTNPINYSSAIEGLNQSTNGSGNGVVGDHAGSGRGVYGRSSGGIGVYGFAQFGTGTSGVYGLAYGAGSKGINGYSENGNGHGVYGSAESGNGVTGIAQNFFGTSGIGGHFSNASSTGYALVTGTGIVGIGNSTPNLNSDERMEINGRLRIRQSASTAGVWFNNSTNSLGSGDGSFYGMKNDTETGIWIGNAWRFWVNNAGNGYLNGSLIQTSDKRLKKDFLSLTHSLSSIYKLNGYHYKWIEEARSKDLQTGLIAQEVQKIFPELVQTDEKGFLSVNYIGLVPHLIEAVKELRDENNSLKLNNKTLSSRLDKIEAMLPAIQPNTENLNSKK